MSDGVAAAHRTPRYERIIRGSFCESPVASVTVEQTLVPFDRITVDPAKLGGKPCIRGYRFSVEHLLELLAAGWDVPEIQADFPFIEPEDVQQALGYAAALARNEIYIPLQEPARGRADPRAS